MKAWYIICTDASEYVDALEYVLFMFLFNVLF